MKIAIDFESYYDSKTFTLKKMSVVEYVRDPRFKVFGLGYIRGNDEGWAEPGWIGQKNVHTFLTSIDWSETDVIAHNVKFDGFILRDYYGIRPRSWIDTKGMSRAVLGKTIRNHSLATIAEHFGFEPKGVMKTDGLTELTPEQEAELSTYCLHDVELCANIYSRLADEFPASQYPALHQTVRMFVEPKIRLNVPLLEECAKSEAERKATIFSDLQIDKRNFMNQASAALTLVGILDEPEYDEPTPAMKKSVFASNVKFPRLLELEGFEVPMKKSPRTGKDIPAIALGDTEFLDMVEGENERLRTLCEARIAAKSTLLETRSTKLARVGASGNWPFDVEFSGANQTHRYSGGSGAGGNAQNFTRGSALRRAVKAPNGWGLVIGDFSNIELRMVAYISKDPGLIGAIEKGVDLYCEFASLFFGRTITKENETERRFGKCIAENTLVITDHGCKEIQDVTTEDKVWDGSEFVNHDGLIDNGIRETISFNRLWLTPDHPILCGVQWREAQLVEQDENLRFLASDRASVKLSSLDTSKGREGALLASFESAIAAHKNEWSMSQISNLAGLRAATIVLKKPGQKSATGSTLAQWPTTNTEPDYSTVYRLLSRGATIQKIGSISITEREEYGFMTVGVPTKQSFCALFKLSKDGTSQLLKWIEPTSTADMYRATYALCLEQRTWLINAESKTLKHVYDISNAGPRNQFTVLTADGPIIVHNCAILGLGYGMGAAKFRKTVRLQTGDDISEDDAERAVDLYRSRYTRVPLLWYLLNSSIGLMNADGDRLVPGLPIKFTKHGIILPSGLVMRYPNLRKDAEDQWIYDTWGKVKSAPNVAKLYGGKVLENICQGLAGELCKEVALQFGDDVTGLVHDEIHLCVPMVRAEGAKKRLERAMTTPPVWLPRIKLGAEVAVGKNWLDCK
jgi:hypothetical protein